MEAAAKLATYDDLLAEPGDTHAEIIDGVIVAPPAPLPKHARAQRNTGELIGGPFDPNGDGQGPGGWWILPEVEVRLAALTVVRPDLSGWRRGRLPSPWDVRPIDVAPDWVCEILSPSNAAHDRVTKRRLYAAHEIPYYWIIDPEARTLEALRFDRATQGWFEVGSYDDESVARVEPFDAIELEVGRIFVPKK